MIRNNIKYRAGYKINKTLKAIVSYVRKQINNKKLKTY